MFSKDVLLQIMLTKYLFRLIVAFMDTLFDYAACRLVRARGIACGSSEAQSGPR